MLYWLPILYVQKKGFGEIVAGTDWITVLQFLRLIMGLENFGSSFLDTLVCMLIMHARVYNMYVCMCVCIYIYESGPRTMVWSHPPPHLPKPRICFSIWEAQPPICTFFCSIEEPQLRHTYNLFIYCLQAYSVPHTKFTSQCMPLYFMFATYTLVKAYLCIPTCYVSGRSIYLQTYIP